MIRCVSNTIGKCVGKHQKIFTHLQVNHMPENRRVKMTKKMIKDAMLELLEKQPLEKITVTDICENADVNRSTFYAYYEDAGQLLLEIENDVVNQLPVSPDTAVDYFGERFLATLEDFFDYVRENERLFRILIVQRDNSSFSLRIVNAVMEKYRMPLESTSKFPYRYAYIYCVSGVIGIMKEWISNSFPITAREFAKIALQMCINATS